MTHSTSVPPLPPCPFTNIPDRCTLRFPFHYVLPRLLHKTAQYGWWFNQSRGTVLSALAEICDQSGTLDPRTTRLLSAEPVPSPHSTDSRREQRLKSGESGSHAVALPSRAKDLPPDPRVVALRWAMDMWKSWT